VATGHPLGIKAGLAFGIEGKKIKKLKILRIKLLKKILKNSIIS
jgi:hypothetical protein